MNHSNKGQTLLELLIYVVIFGLAAGVFSSVLIVFTRVQGQEAASSEVTQQLSFVQSTIQRLVREAVNIENTAGATSTVLTLRMAATSTDPTIISSGPTFDADAIYLKQGTSATTTLTNDRVKVSQFEVVKYENPGGHAVIQVDLSLTYNSPRLYQQVTRNLKTAIGRVTAATFDDNLLPNIDATYSIGIPPTTRWKNLSLSYLLNLGQLTTDPVDAQNGSIYYRTTDNVFRGYASSSWANLGGVGWAASSTDIYNTNSGNVGIGINPPQYKLDVTGTFRASATSTFSGNVGIGTASPNDTLEVTGSIITTGIQDTGKTTKMWLSGSAADKTLDYMEYTSDAFAQTAYVSSDTTGTTTMILRPNAAGDETALDYQNPGSGAHWDKVDEEVADDGTTYVGTTGPGNTAARDLYNLPASGGFGTINSITIYFRCWIWHASVGGLAAPSMKNGTTVTDGTQVLLPIDDLWHTFSETWTINPADSAAFEWADIDALQIGVWLKKVSDYRDVYCTQVYVEVNYNRPNLQSYSEATIKQQGSYSLKGIAQATGSLNDTLTRTVSPTIDLTGKTQIKFDIYSSRTGSNIKIGIHDTGGTTTEITPNITSAGAWQTVTWDISGVSDANKDAIDKIIVTIVNADAANTFYLDNMYSPSSGASNDITFTTAGSERMRINTSGNVGIGVTSFTSGGAKFEVVDGITFPATQVTSANVNTLDDYEEGTWTMGLAFGGGTTGITYSLYTGYYTKIGNVVTVSGYIILNTKGSSTGNAVITGLPFTVANSNAGFATASLYFNHVTFTNQFEGVAAPNTTTILLQQSTTLGAVTNLTDANFANNSEIIINCTYRVL